MKARKGFTIVELMLVVAIIGLLASISVGVLGVTRAKSRDAKRVSDIGVIRAALEQHWLRNATYPTENTAVDIGTGAYTVLGVNGFEAAPGTGTVYLTIPVGPKNAEYYGYQSTVATGYALRFTLERPSTIGSEGTYYAHADGSTDADASSK